MSYATNSDKWMLSQPPGEAPNPIFDGQAPDETSLLRKISRKTKPNLPQDPHLCQPLEDAVEEFLPRRCQVREFCGLPRGDEEEENA